MRFRRGYIKIVLVCAAVLAVVTGMCKGLALEVSASGNGKNPGDGSGVQLLFVNTDASLYESADEDSGEVLKLHAQDLVIPVELGTAWSRVMTQGVTGYVRSDYLQVENPNPLALEEFEEQEAYETALINEMERLIRQKRHSRIYGIVMIVIITAIFAVGIVNTVLGRGRDETSQER